MRAIAIEAAKVSSHPGTGRNPLACRGRECVRRQRGRGRLSRGGIILPEIGWWIWIVPDTTLGVENGQRGTTRIVKVTVLESCGNGGQLDLVVYAILILEPV
jgi:hypothetical protein